MLLIWTTNNYCCPEESFRGLIEIRSLHMAHLKEWHSPGRASNFIVMICYSELASGKKGTNYKAPLFAKSLHTNSLDWDHKAKILWWKRRRKIGYFLSSFSFTFQEVLLLLKQSFHTYSIGEATTLFYIGNYLSNNSSPLVPGKKVTEAYCLQLSQINRKHPDSISRSVTWT